jgi:hypothetical protein
MKLAKTLLWINTALFVAFGLGFIFAPAFFANLITGAVPSTPIAMMDMRAIYGGTALGIALFFGYCARINEIKLGAIASMLVLLCTAFGRIVGMVTDGSPNFFMFALLAAEIIVGGLFAYALKKIGG